MLYCPVLPYCSSSVQFYCSCPPPTRYDQESSEVIEQFTEFYCPAGLGVIELIKEFGVTEFYLSVQFYCSCSPQLVLTDSDSD